VLIEEPRILGKINAFAILSGESLPDKKFARYLNKNGLMLYSDSLPARVQAPLI